MIESCVRPATLHMDDCGFYGHIVYCNGERSADFRSVKEAMDILDEVRKNSPSLITDNEIQPLVQKIRSLLPEELDEHYVHEVIESLKVQYPERRELIEHLSLFLLETEHQELIFSECEVLPI